MSAPPASFVAREKAAYTTIDDRLFIFGGLSESGTVLGDGAIYDPAQDSWTVIPRDSSTPDPRQLASAVWTGLRVFVLGGTNADSSLAMADGGRFDPATSSWLSLPNLPVGRIAPHLASAKDAAFVMTWGGYGPTGAPLGGGERFGYNGQNWTPLVTGPGSPARVTDPTWVAGDNGAFLIGGRAEGAANAGQYAFTSANAQWMALPWGGLSERWGALGAWDGSALFVWGGRNDNQVLSNGYRFASAGGWTALAASTELSARWAPNRRAGFAYALGTGDIVFIGGVDDSGNLLSDGARYQHASGSWTKIAAWSSGEKHEYGVFAHVAGELLVWGGRDGAKVTATGERFLP